MSYIGSGAALGLFLTKVHIENYYHFLWTSNYFTGALLSVFAVFLLEIAFSWAPNNGGRYRVFSLRNSMSYCPLMFLLSIFLIDLFPLQEYQRQFFGYFYVTMAFVFCVSVVVCLRMYFSNTFEASEQRHGSKDGYDRKPRPFWFERGLFIFTLAATTYFFCLLFTTNKALTDDSYYYYNMVWNLSHGSFTYSGSDLDIPTHIFGTHLNLILFPVALLFLIWPSVNVLILLQSIIIASAIIPLGLLGRKKTGSSFVGIAAAVGFFFYPAIQMGQDWGFVVDLWGTSFLIWAFYFLEIRRPILFLSFCVLAMSCKEVLAIAVFGIGVWAWINHKKRALGVGTLCFSLCWFIAAVVMKTHFNMGVDVHEGFLKQLFSLLGNPKELIIYFFNPRRVFTFIQIGFPFGFLFLGCPLLLLLSLPFMAVQFLNPAISVVKFYYFAPVVPFLVVGTLYSVDRIRRFFSDPRKVLSILSVFVILNSVGLYLFYNPFNYVSQRTWLAHTDTPHRKMVRNVVSRIPNDATVSITPELRSLISERKYHYIFPRGRVRGTLLNAFSLEPFENPVLRDADYVVIDLQQPSHSEIPPQNWRIQELFNNNKYGIVFCDDGLVIFKRSKDRKEGLRNIFVNENEIKGKALVRDYGRGLSLAGMEFYPKEGLKRGEGLKMVLYWKIQSYQYENFQVLITFTRLNSNEITWIHTPLFELIEPKRWRAGDIVRDSFIVPVGDEFLVRDEPYQMDIRVLREASIENGNTSYESSMNVMILPSF